MSRKNVSTPGSPSAGPARERDAKGPGRFRHLSRYRDDPRAASLVLAAASAVSVALILYFGRGTTFSGDESVWVASSPGIDLTTILTPQGGHLVAVSRTIYWSILEMFGLGYLPFRLLGIAAILVTVWLLYLYGRRRTDAFVALAPCLVLLFFAPDHLHLFQGNGFTVMSSLALGIAALLALDREDLRGDGLACLFLIIGIFSYSTILPFVLAAGVFILFRPDRWRRIWVPLVPAAIFCLWRVWLVVADTGGPAGGLDPLNLPLIPAWIFQSLSGVINSLTGLSFDFSGAGTTGTVGLAGPPLAILFIGAVGWKIAAKGLGRALATALVVPLSLFALQAVVSTDIGAQIPGVTTRYLYPGAVAVILLAYELARGWRPPPLGLLAVWLVALCGLGTNLTLMKDSGNLARESGYELRSLVGGAALALESRPEVVKLAEPSSARATPIDYLVGMARQDFGEFGFGPEELAEQPAERRGSIDQVGIAMLGIELVEIGGRPGPDVSCRMYRADQNGISRAEARSGLQLLRAPMGGTVTLGRFADSPSIGVGTLSPGILTEMDLPRDSATEPWDIAVDTPDLEICSEG